MRWPRTRRARAPAPSARRSPPPRSAPSSARRRLAVADPRREQCGATRAAALPCPPTTALPDPVGYRKQTIVLQLLIGQVDLRLAVSLQSAHPYIAHHSHHHAVMQRELEMPAHRVLVRPVAADERFAHHRRERPIDGIGLA